MLMDFWRYESASDFDFEELCGILCEHTSEH